MHTHTTPAPGRRAAGGRAAALVFAAALALAGCASGGDGSTATASVEGGATPTGSATPQDPVADASADASADPSVEATASADPSADAAADGTGGGPEAPSPAPTAPSPQPVPPATGGPVTGAPAETTWSFHLPAPGKVDACQFMDGGISCFFEDQPAGASCTGDTPLAHLAFDGTGTMADCWPLGEAGTAPSPAVGTVVADPDGAFLCEIIDAPAVGVRCTSTATGTTATITGAGVGVG